MKKKSRRMAASTVSLFVMIMRGMHVNIGFGKRKSSTMEAVHMDLLSETIDTGSKHGMTFLSRSTGHRHSFPVQNQSNSWILIN
jgi:hypothetical protein